MNISFLSYFNKAVIILTVLVRVFSVRVRNREGDLLPRLLLQIVFFASEKIVKICAGKVRKKGIRTDSFGTVEKFTFIKYFFFFSLQDSDVFLS